jgi:phosphogluconate dehydratase
MLAAFKAGAFDRDVVCVVRWQGLKPTACRAASSHRRWRCCTRVQVALVTDGRNERASGKVPAAIHVSPEAAAGGPCKVRTGDVVRLTR